jgi:hypothetical protein
VNLGHAATAVNDLLFRGTISRGYFADMTRPSRRLLIAEQASVAIFSIALRKHRMCRCQVRLNLRQGPVEVFALSRRLSVAEDRRVVRQAAERCVAFHDTWAKQMGIAKSGRHGDLTFDELFDSSYIFGTPDECLTSLSELRAVGIEDVICNMNFAGVLEHRQVLHSMTLFASKVMPQLA